MNAAEVFSLLTTVLVFRQGPIDFSYSILVPTPSLASPLRKNAAYNFYEADYQFLFTYFRQKGKTRMFLIGDSIIG